MVARDDIEMKCTIEGHPPPSVKWYRNSKELVPDSRTLISEVLIIVLIYMRMALMRFYICRMELKKC